MRPKRSLLRCDSGASAVELAIVITALLGVVFGIFNLAAAVWTMTSLRYAAQSAARCASVDSTNCGSPTAIQAYALTQYSGQSLGTNPFTYTASGCGHTVTASYNYPLSIPLFGTYSIPMSASSCFP